MALHKIKRNGRIEREKKNATEKESEREKTMRKNIKEMRVATKSNWDSAIRTEPNMARTQTRTRHSKMIVKQSESNDEKSKRPKKKKRRQKYKTRKSEIIFLMAV